LKIVLDTNVLVSGLLNPFGAPGEIVRLIGTEAICLCYDVRILTEYQRVLSRSRFPFHPPHIQALLEQIKAEGMAIAAKPLKAPLPDPDDEPFLEVAIASRCSFLITGNLKHYPVKACHGMKVLSPAEFIDVLRKQKS
jgi:putative PIN family toxin of toxin-antitoxin system